MHNINDAYFEWMYQIVGDESINPNLSYKKLLKYLHNVEFTYLMEMDSNRAHDGINLRYRFEYECGYSNEDIRKTIDKYPCSILEMMVALALRIEEQIMDDPDYGDRTGQWFWTMIVSLGLGSMSDDRYDENYIYPIIDRFLSRNYSPEGVGGLFILRNCDCDIRDIEIWVQAMWYLDENFDFSL